MSTIHGSSQQIRIRAKAGRVGGSLYLTVASFGSFYKKLARACNLNKRQYQILLSDLNGNWAGVWFGTSQDLELTAQVQMREYERWDSYSSNDRLTVS